MIPMNDFWRKLHELSQAYEAEGKRTSDRQENIIAQFSAMPPLVQRELLAGLKMLSLRLPQLYPVVVETSQNKHEPTLKSLAKAG